MITPQFEEAYKRLNPEQKKAVDTIEGPVMVVAGPGTGKTQVLTLRIANILIKTQSNPENVLALTFTESAVLAMRKRLVDLIGSDGYRVGITTFHSFCNEVIKNNPESFPLLLSSESITELEQIQLLQQIIENEELVVLRPFGDPLYHVKTVLSVINELKKEGVSPSRFEEGVKKQQEEFSVIDDLYYASGTYKGKMKGKYITLQKDIEKNLELVKVYKKYQLKLKELRLYDYNDMIMEVVSALEKDGELLLRLQERYQYILVDEHQDTNASQNRIIELLGNFFENPNLFVVGDEKQAIFRFQGASLENFLYFKKLYPEAILINLSFNYRSNQTVLDASGSLIRKNVIPEGSFLQRIELKAQAGLPSEKIKVAVFENYFDEYRFLAEDIKQKIDKGTKPSEIAIIYRNNRDVFPVVEAFEQFNVPFYIESDQDILSDLDVQKLVWLFRAVESFGLDVNLVPVLHFDFFNLTPLDVFKLIKFSRKNDISLYEILADEKNMEGLELANKEGLLNVYRLLTRWCILAKNEEIENVFISIFRESGLLKKVLDKVDVIEKLEKFSTFYQEAKLQKEKRADFNLTDLINYINLLKTHQILIKRPPRGSLIKAVRLMTAHKSKGLEFEYVYIIQAFDGHWGNKKSKQYFRVPWEQIKDSNINLNEELLDLNEDERRLFYVAMTRAKRGITISFSKVSLEGKEQLPSQFLEEIDTKYQQIINLHLEKDERIPALFDYEGQQNLSTLFLDRKDQGLGIKDKEFYQFLFDSEGLSVTGFNNYLKCPWRYFYSNLIQVPFIAEKQQIFGIAIHTAISWYLNFGLKIKEESYKEKKGQEMLIKFDDCIKRSFLSKSEKEELINRGKVILEGYFENVLKRLDGEFKCEFEIKNVFLTDNIKINGRIDKVQTFPNSTEAVIYDLKTGKPKSRGVIEGTAISSKISGDYKRQLNFYKLLLDRFDAKKMKAKKGVIEFIEPDEKGRFKMEEFMYQEEELTELKEQIIKVAQEIRELEFWDRICDDKECEYCKLRELMI